MNPRARAEEVIKDSQYIQRWFAAENFFNTFYTSDVLTGDYFITGDDWMESKIYAARKITPEGIETVGRGNSKEEAMQILKEHRKKHGPKFSVVPSEGSSLGL